MAGRASSSLTALELNRAALITKGRSGASGSRIDASLRPLAARLISAAPHTQHCLRGSGNTCKAWRYVEHVASMALGWSARLCSRCPSAAHRNAPLRGGGEVETRAAALRRPGPRQRCLDVPVRERLGAATEPHATRRRRRGGAGGLYGCLGGCRRGLAGQPGGLRRRTAVKRVRQCVGRGPARPSTRRWTWM